MKISCPSCEATYQLADRAIGATGRKVRCTRCGTIWHAMPDAPVPEPEDDEAGWNTAAQSKTGADDKELDAWRAALNEDDAETEIATPHRETAEDGTGDEAADEGDDGKVVPFRAARDTGETASADPAGWDEADVDTADEPATDGPASDKAPDAAEKTIDAEPAGFKADPAPVRPVRVGAKTKPRRKPPGRAQPLSSAVVGGLILAALVVVIGTAFAVREPIVRAVPDLAGLYELVGLPTDLRGLAFADVKTYRHVEGSTPVLVVEGRIENVSDRDRPVPQIRFGLKSAAGREVYAWTMAPAKPDLASEETMTFKSKLPAPPDAATDVQVRFADSATP